MTPWRIRDFHDDDLDAAIRLWGDPATGTAWPGRDFTTKAAGVLEAELTAAGIPHDLKVYPGARHSFFNDQWRAYDPAAAADSWQRVLAFFAEHVRDRQAAQR
jgi:acetyl esterase/lipase